MAVEGGQGPVELLGHLGVHVFADDLEAALPQIVVDHSRNCKPTIGGGQTGELTCAICQLVPALPLDGRQVKRPGEDEAGEQAGNEEQPRTANAAAAAVDDREQRQQDDVDDGVVGTCELARGWYPSAMNSDQLPWPLIGLGAYSYT